MYTSVRMCCGILKDFFCLLEKEMKMINKVVCFGLISEGTETESRNPEIYRK